MCSQKVIGLWSAASEETTRVLAFLCISRLLHVTQNRILETCIKVRRPQHAVLTHSVSVLFGPMMLCVRIKVDVLKEIVIES